MSMQDDYENQVKQWQQCESYVKMTRRQANPLGDMRNPLETKLGLGGLGTVDGSSVKSPIQRQLDDQADLLVSLTDSLNMLIEKILLISAGDPRAMPDGENNAKSSPASCQLDETLKVHNLTLMRQRDILDELTRLICL